MGDSVFYGQETESISRSNEQNKTATTGVLRGFYQLGANSYDEHSDAHDNIPVDYLWHSSVPDNKRDNMFCGPCGPKPTSRDEAAGGSPITSEVDITYDH